MLPEEQYNSSGAFVLVVQPSTSCSVVHKQELAGVGTIPAFRCCFVHDRMHATPPIVRFGQEVRDNPRRRNETKQACLSFSEYAELTVEISYRISLGWQFSGRTCNKKLLERPNVSLQIKVVTLGVEGIGVHCCMGVQRGVPTQPTATNGAPNITAFACARGVLPITQRESDGVVSF